MIGFLKRLFGGKPSPAPVHRWFAHLQKMKYTPMLRSFEVKRKIDVGGRETLLLCNIVSAGAVQYKYLLVVNDQSGEPCLFIASEVNLMAKTFGGGSHFLGVFPGDGHANHGDSNDWADEDKFVEAAVEMVRGRFEKPSPG